MRTLTILSTLFCFVLPSGGNAQSTLTVKLLPDIVLTWDNQTSQYVEDEAYNGVMTNIKDYRGDLVAMITDSTVTVAKVCDDDLEITRGMLAFGLLEQIEQLPLYQIFKMQFCVFVIGCPYPEGLVYYIQGRSDEAQKMLTTHYAKQEKDRKRR